MLSVIIVTHNSAYVLADALDSVAAHLPDVPVIIVDNGSTDDTLAIARDRSGAIIVHGHGNVGFGTGVNLGIQAASTPLVLVVNPDTTITGVDHTRLQELATRKQVGLIACTISVGGQLEEALKASWGWKGELIWTLWTFYLKPRGLVVRRPAAKPGQPAWIGGAAFISAREEWAHVGGFDERIFLYYEDHDLSRRYRDQGLPLLTSDAVLVAHVRQEEKRGVAVDQVASWVFRSLVQLAATRDGTRTGQRVVAATMGALRLIETAGRAARWIPVAGRISLRKADSAQRVRAYLLGDPERTSAHCHYQEANALFARFATNAAPNSCKGRGGRVYLDG